MVIRNLNLKGVSVLKSKTDAPLVIDSDAVLSFSISLQRFKSVAWRDSQFIHLKGGMDGYQFPQGNLLNRSWQSAGTLSLKDQFGFTALEAFYHTMNITLSVNNVKRYLMIPWRVRNALSRPTGNLNVAGSSVFPLGFCGFLVMPPRRC